MPLAMSAAASVAQHLKGLKNELRRTSCICVRAYRIVDFPGNVRVFNGPLRGTNGGFADIARTRSFWDDIRLSCRSPAMAAVFRGCLLPRAE